MSIKLYTGLQGSGKSYEVVSVVILGSLRDGRRVVSNIAGLNYEAMRELLISEGSDPESIGTLLQVQHHDVTQTNFFRTDTDAAEGIETVVQGGDVVVLDEIWRWWEKDSQVTPRQQNFFRMHRHMLHPESGMSCEIVLISQDVSDVCRKIRSVVEKTYVMTKHTALGSDKRYRIDIYARAKFTSRTEPLNSLQKSYDPKYFPLYKSHSAGGDVLDPKEVSVDKRGNIFSRPIIKYGIPVSLLMVIPLLMYVYRFFHPKQKPTVEHTQTVASASPAKPETHSNAPVVSNSWRVVGYFNNGKAINFLVKDSSGQVRLLSNPPTYKVSSIDSSVLLPEGGFATNWGQIGGQSRGILP